MITDWDKAYSNVEHVAGCEAFPPRWQAAATAFRDDMSARGRLEADLAYGRAPRQRLDLFHPEGEACGLAVFIHGGYWRRFDKSLWSHLAAGALGLGWAVAVPSHTLAPEARVAEMTREVAHAVSFAAARVSGPLCLAGHSAGAQLAARMVCAPSALPAHVAKRIAHVLAISGVHDLRPVLRLALNETVRLDTAEAMAESPALLAPMPGTRLTAWVGAAELPEFQRQSALLANIWTGAGATTRLIRDPERHHFDVIEALAEPNSPLAAAFTGADGWLG